MEKIINFLLDSDNRVPVTSIVENEKKGIVDVALLSDSDSEEEEEKEKEEKENDSGNQVPVISIVGLGGMGKTTLARLVYNNRKVQEQFELKAWVYVSETFDVIGLTKAILESFGFPADGNNLDLLQRQLQQRLTSKKYLLVLDDVWNANEECWEQFLLPFNHASSGSKIIVTTRDKEVAYVLQSTNLLDLVQLEESDCWELFVRHAFHGRNVSQHPSLESIGKRIVGKCGGLPLAVKTMGKLLRKRFSQRQWDEILETDMWTLLEGDKSINTVLRLSYHNLPSCLKRCFAFCSVFPRGYKFQRGKLIKLWMAEGLLKCYGIEKREEELGNEFFDDLESISFFQQSNPGNINYVMHDLVSDLAKSVSGEFCLRIEDDRNIPESDRTRHIWCSIGYKDAKPILNKVYKIKGLRSLILRTQNSYECRSVCVSFSRLKYLRMLSFQGRIRLSKLSNEISNLKLLRYLDLSFTQIDSLPNSICMLYNLQTLLLNGCSHLTKLPSDFYKLVNLHHLDLGGTSLKKMPKQIGRLNHLQTLTDFVVGRQSGSDIKELAKLNHLQGTLSIRGLQNVTDPADAAAANLKDKKYLEELVVIFERSSHIDIHRDFSVLEALQPNSNLNRLTIRCYGGSSFPNWLGDCHLPNLVSLQLYECKFCFRLPPLGQLPSLNELSISSCYGIEIIGEEFYGKNSSNVPFRSLELLDFYDMSQWKEWLCVEGCFPLLKKLTIRSCPKLKMALPQHLPSLQELMISKCGELDASIPKAANLSVITLHGCQNILVNELPSRLINVYFWEIRFPGCSFTSLHKNLFHGAYLEELTLLSVSGFEEYSFSLDLPCCTFPLRKIYITGWRCSFLPFALHLFTNLHTLNLIDCPNLESFPVGGLPSSLSFLQIRKCPKLIASRQDWGLLQLNSLTTFKVSDDFENVESFPEENLLPATLNILKLTNCSKLRIINYKGLLHLKSLEALSISRCPCLERLPEEGLLHLKSLEELSISRCPCLEQLYKEEGGERWHKISHIPSVRIKSG